MRNNLKVSTIATFAVLAFMFLPYSANASAGPINQADFSDPEAFRAVMLDLVTTLEEALGLEPKASATIRDASYEAMELWLSFTRDPEQFLVSSSLLKQRVEESMATHPELLELMVAGTREALPPATKGVSTSPFEPEYPPDETPYRETVLLPLRILGLVTETNDRCDAIGWTIAYDVFLASKVAAEAAKVVISQEDAACAVAGCDPTGIGCAIVCVVTQTAAEALELAVAALQVFEAPIELCAIQDGGVDSAEIEAAFENSRGNFLTLSNLDGALTSHDSALASHALDIKLDLESHGADIESLLGRIQATADENQRLIKKFMSRQLEILRLLITPEVLREVNEDILMCTGDNCLEFPDFQLCQNGSLKWKCQP